MIRVMAWVREAAPIQARYDWLLRVWRWHRFVDATFGDGRATAGILSGSEDRADP